MHREPSFPIMKNKGDNMDVKAALKCIRVIIVAVEKH